jgi:Aminoglycoside-2''-adenylyltransferase
VDAFEPDLTMWDPWRPEEVARRLRDVDAPWYIVAGWAIDLFLGSVRREHTDIEIAVPRSRHAEVLDALEGFEFFAAGVPRSGFVTALPVADASDSDSHQTWVREPASGLWRLDIFSEPSEGETWICRRNDQIRMPYERLIERTEEGIPYGRPEIVLLFKAKAARSKDEDDFAAVLTVLDAKRRHWLASALELVHPGHRWLARLGT